MCVGSDEKDVEQVLWCVYGISRVRCALGCVYCWPYCFCTVCFGLMLGVSTLQILFYITLPYTLLYLSTQQVPSVSAHAGPSAVWAFPQGAGEWPVRQVHWWPAAAPLATLPPEAHEAVPGTAGEDAATCAKQQASVVVCVCRLCTSNFGVSDNWKDCSMCMWLEAMNESQRRRCSHLRRTTSLHCVCADCVQVTLEWVTIGRVLVCVCD